MILSTTALVPVLLIRQCQSYWCDTIHCCPNTSPTYTIQCITTSVPVLLMYTTVILPVLLIPHSPLLSQYQSYWYDTVYQCPSTSPNGTTQSTFVAILVLLIWYSLSLRSTSPTDTTAHFCPSMGPADSPLLPQCKAYWQDSVLLPYTSPTDTLLIPVLVIFNSPLLPQF